MGPSDDPCKYGRYGAGTPTHLSHSLRLTRADYPSSERIVEDILRMDTTIEQIIAQEAVWCQRQPGIHKKGCSRTKRKGRPGSELSSAVSKVAQQRVVELRAGGKTLVCDIRLTI
jgi:hypothetical protein